MKKTYITPKIKEVAFSTGHNLLLSCSNDFINATFDGSNFEYEGFTD